MTEETLAPKEQYTLQGLRPTLESDDIKLDISQLSHISDTVNTLIEKGYLYITPDIDGVGYGYIKITDQGVSYLHSLDSPPIDGSIPAYPSEE